MLGCKKWSSKLHFLYPNICHLHLPLSVQQLAGQQHLHQHVQVIVRHSHSVSAWVWHSAHHGVGPECQHGGGAERVQREQDERQHHQRQDGAGYATWGCQCVACTIHDWSQRCCSRVPSLSCSSRARASPCYVWVRRSPARGPSSIAAQYPSGQPATAALNWLLRSFLTVWRCWSTLNSGEQAGPAELFRCRQQQVRRRCVRLHCSPVPTSVANAGQPTPFNALAST